MIFGKINHPGFIEQKYNDCVIHSINLLIGGPIIYSRDSWCKWYASRRKQAYEEVYEDVRLHGVSLKCLKHIIY